MNTCRFKAAALSAVSLSLTMIQQKLTESCEDDDRQTVVTEISDLSPAHSVIMMKINQDPKPHLKLSM